MRLAAKVFDGSQLVLDDLPIPMIIGKSLPGSEGESSDYIYLNVNKAFEEKSKIKRDALIGNRFLEIYPYLKGDPFERAEFIGEVAYGDKAQDELSFFSRSWNGWIQLKVIKLSEGRFFALYIDTSELKHHLDKLTRIIASLEMVISDNSEDINYQNIVDTLREVADAKFAVFNLLDEAGLKSRTAALSTETVSKKNAEDLWAERIIGKTWEESPVTRMPFGDALTREFNKLSEVTEAQELKKTLEAIEVKIGLGETVVAKVDAGDRIVGYFLFSMPDGVPYRNQSIVNTFTKVMGLAIALKESERESKEEKEQFESLFENMGSGATVLEVTGLGQTAKDYVIKDINKMGLKFHNILKKDAIGKTMHDLNENFDRSGLIDSLKEVWETGKDNYTLTNIKSHDRQLKWYECRAFTLPSGYLVATYNDVTERMAAERDLAESEHNLKQLIENMEQGGRTRNHIG